MSNLETLPTDDLLQQVVTAKRHLEQAKAHYTTLCDEMSRRVETGDLDPGGFSFDDVPFAYSEGKRTFDYPDNVKTLEKGVKEAKRLAESDGSATPKTGAPFWTLRI
jgi:hypothetical protein